MSIIEAVPKIKSTIVSIPADVEEEEYPPEAYERWDRLYEEAKQEVASGESVPQTVEELATEFGIDLNGIDLDDAAAE